MIYVKGLQSGQVRKAYKSPLVHSIHVKNVTQLQNSHHFASLLAKNRLKIFKLQWIKGNKINSISVLMNYQIQKL